MARSKKTDNNQAVLSNFQHGTARRLNIPEATETKGGLSKGQKRFYRYSPHLTPKLRFDEAGVWDNVKEIIGKAVAGKKLTSAECDILKGVGDLGFQPWLEWAGKQEQQARHGFNVDDVVLHIHERVSAQAILASAKRSDSDQQDFFARPHLHQEQALQYYRHSVEWTNRLVLGDSLQVMSSLAHREGFSGQVQMIYFDPPYGIKFSSNWQNELGKREVKEKDDDLNREPEVIRAYRDTWTLGVHSYLSYLKQRLIIARDLLKKTGSIFVQISDENLHRVRLIMDEVFGPENFLSIITVKKTGGMGEQFIDNVSDYIIWYSRDKKEATYHPIFTPKKLTEGVGERYSRVELEDGSIRPISDEEAKNPELLPAKSSVFLGGPLTSQTASESTTFSFKLEDRGIQLRKGGWKTNKEGMERLILANRLVATKDFVNYKIKFSDFPAVSIGNLWDDTMGTAEQNKVYVVQTTLKVIQRCMLMTTAPGDLVLDPTCGSGTTAYVAEQWGRRWITIDSSRVAVAIARQRLLTAVFDSYKTKDPLSGVDPAAPQNPSYGFFYKTIPHITLRSIARNRALDAIYEKHALPLSTALAHLNQILERVNSEHQLAERMVEKFKAKYTTEGARAISDPDLRRWLLPRTEPTLVNFGTSNQKRAWRDAIPKNSGWREWEVPFDSDSDWPNELAVALDSFRTTWKSKMADINQAIERNADQEDLVDQPDIVRGVHRVSGPFTVEGVRPEELALGEDGKVYDPTANDLDDVGTANADGYLDLMIGLIRKDGVTFLGNRRAEFGNIVKEAGRGFHARGRWKTKTDDLDDVAIFFGPQYGPVNAPMMQEAIEGAQGLKEVDELVVAGFSFDAAAQEIAKEKDSEELRIHLAHIRPDVSPGMQGLLKETANSQLFTVFGQPDIKVSDAGDGMKKVKMGGVCVYNPLTGEITEAAANKVAAWFLDVDYDGRCFCVSQAFFPDKDAWAKIAKALGSAVTDGAFEDSTESWPFKLGKHNRIAVKVIDPRGNEVMAIKTLNA